MIKELGGVCLHSQLFCSELCPFLLIHPKQLNYELKFMVLFVTNELVSLLEITIMIMMNDLSGFL